MTPPESHAVAGRGTTGPENTPRLRLKPKAPTSGHVDGAWWPHSDDLAHELPDLLSVLSVRLGVIERVMYSLAEWTNVPTRMMSGDRKVRLDGYRGQPASTLEVLGMNKTRILLIVVPPHTDSDLAHEVMMTAAAPDNVSSVDDLLAITTHDREVRDLTAVTERQWAAGAGATR
ncbi:DUF5994 family protein [Mycobacterium deserti]|uniref:DUF5994 family protein n=1 Tax=Mycobacterium deserti TaxID=2978347 RepID=A0ABT2M7Y6_9MYCO|nr:DUF5994 family protein [Mycobacterium deserti]MCT7658378.1 DUF5994 family protein [Mycobacterium deserti]